MKNNKGEEVICNEDWQECEKCDRAVKGGDNPCMVRQISQNCVVEVKDITDKFVFVINKNKGEK